MLSFDSVYTQLDWQAAECARQLDRFRQTQSMRGRRYPREGRRMLSVPKGHRARWRTGHYGVHHNHIIDAAPSLNQLRSFPTADLHINPQLPQAFGDHHPGSVVTAVPVATSYD